MTTPSNKPVPSNLPQDLLFNAEQLDQVLNSALLSFIDRLGNARLTVAGAVDRIAAVNPRGPWASGEIYALKDIVTSGGSAWICVQAHTSGATFSGDASKWAVFQGLISSDLSSTDPAKGAALAGHTNNYGLATTVRAELLRLGALVLASGLLKVGSNASTSTRDAIVIARAITGLTDCHAFRDESTIRLPTDYGGYCTFDCKVNVLYNATFNHVHSVQDRVVWTASAGGVLENQVGMYCEPEFYGAAGSVLKRHGIRVKDHIGDAGIVVEQIGVLIEPLTKGQQNYAFVGQDGRNIFNGNTLFGALLAPAPNEGVSHYGVRLTGSNQTSFQASGVGLGAAGAWKWAGFTATPVVKSTAVGDVTLAGMRAQDAIVEAGTGATVAEQVGFLSEMTADVKRWAMKLMGGAKSFFGGRSFFGGTTPIDPVAHVHIASGTTSTPPLVINPGPLSTTPVNGAIEFDGTTWYRTKGGVRSEF